MSFVVPKYSKEQVNRAGFILVAPKEYALDEFVWALDVLTNWRVAHAYPINTFQATLRDRLKKIDPKGLVAQRLKRAPSIVIKLERFRTMKLARMQDIGGLRAVVHSIKDVRKLEKLYREHHLQHALVSSKDYIEKPKSDGYRGIHLIFRYKNERTPEYDGLHVELQFRTQLQHAWATAVETMGTFLGQGLKSGQGESLWREFFSRVGAAFAHIENAPAVPGYDEMSRIDVFKSVAELENKLSVLDKLRSFSVAVDKISGSGGVRTYHLIVLDSSRNTVSVTPYPLNRLEQATNDYAEIERRAANGEKLEAVLVSAGPIEALKKAYPNYFLDTHAFIREVNKLIEETESPLGRGSYQRTRVTSVVLDKIVASAIHTPRIDSRLVPQADSISSIRPVLESIKSGASSATEISSLIGVSLRHVHYRLASAEILSCIRRDGGVELTTYGEAWLRFNPGSEGEFLLLRELVELAPFYNVIVPDLFDDALPNRSEVANKLVLYAGLSIETAKRRASTILNWGGALNIHQIDLFEN